MLQSNDVQIFGVELILRKLILTCLKFVTMTGKSLLQGICCLYLVTDAKLLLEKEYRDVVKS